MLDDLCMLHLNVKKEKIKLTKQDLIKEMQKKIINLKSRICIESRERNQAVGIKSKKLEKFS